MCLLSGTRDASGSTRWNIPIIDVMKPIKPATVATINMLLSKRSIGLIRWGTSSLGRRPTRAASANPTPSGKPTHHVATTPQNRPSTVGDSELISLGCPMVKYSTQIRAVI